MFLCSLRVSRSLPALCILIPLLQVDQAQEWYLQRELLHWFRYLRTVNLGTRNHAKILWDPGCHYSAWPQYYLSHSLLTVRWYRLTRMGAFVSRSHNRCALVQSGVFSQNDWTAWILYQDPSTLSGCSLHLAQYIPLHSFNLRSNNWPHLCLASSSHITKWLGHRRMYLSGWLPSFALLSLAWWDWVRLAQW